MSRPGFPIPDDIIKTGCGMSDWVHCTFYGDTVEEVKEKRKKYFEKYPPQGYDTSSTSINRHSDGYYVVSTTRWSSCN
jgi:hypothetical protein